MKETESVYKQTPIGTVEFMMVQKYLSIEVGESFSQFFLHGLSFHMPSFQFSFSAARTGQ